MKLAAKSAAWLLPLLLTGCFFHKTKPTQIQALAPPIQDPLSKSVPTPTELPPPVETIPNRPPTTDTKLPQQTPQKPVKHKKPATKNPEEAANGNAGIGGEKSGVSAIGELSSGDPSDLKQRTVDSLTATERGLNGINRSLNDQEEKTASQIREFVKQARSALATGDVDGAQTLAAKASVLLSELVQ